MAATAKAEKAEKVLRISPPNMAVARFTIRGTAPLMTARFSKKAEIMASQAEGNPAKNRKARGAKDFAADAQAASYIAREGWYGMHAAAFRNACISACRVSGYKMTIAKLSIFALADGYDREEGVPLVRITKGEPQMSVMPVRNRTGVLDMRSRPMWPEGWEMKVGMRYDADQFSLTDITNLLMRVGMQVGVGEGRPDAKEGNGLGYGLFDIVEVVEG